MNRPSHLLQRGSRWHFRRRLPGCELMIQIPLRTTDHTLATRINGDFETMIERFLNNSDEFPDELIATYIEFCLRMQTRYLSKARRESRMSMIEPADTPRYEEIRRKVFQFLIEDGLSVDLPPHRIGEFKTADDLKNAMIAHRRECNAVSKSMKNYNFLHGALAILGREPRTVQQNFQISEAYLEAKAEAYNRVYPPRPWILDETNLANADVPTGVKIDQDAIPAGAPIAPPARDARSSKRPACRLHVQILPTAPL